MENLADKPIEEWYEFYRRIIPEFPDKDDAVQESVIRAYYGLENAHRVNNNWFYTIGINVYKSAISKRKQESLDGHILLSDNNVYNLLFSNEIRGIIANTRMSGKLRKPFELMFFGGYSVNEISDELGIPTGTVKSRVSRAKDCLRESVLKEYL